MTGCRPLSPVFYFSLTHLNAPQKKGPGPCPIRKPALFFLYIALHYLHTTRGRDASKRSIYSGRGWGVMNLYSSVFKLKEKLRSCCVDQLSHALYWRVNKSQAFNLHWKEMACRDHNRQCAQRTTQFDQCALADSTTHCVLLTFLSSHTQSCRTPAIIAALKPVSPVRSFYCQHVQRCFYNCASLGKFLSRRWLWVSAEIGEPNVEPLWVWNISASSKSN